MRIKIVKYKKNRIKQSIWIDMKVYLIYNDEKVIMMFNSLKYTQIRMIKEITIKNIFQRIILNIIKLCNYIIKVLMINIKINIVIKMDETLKLDSICLIKIIIICII